MTSLEELYNQMNDEFAIPKPPLKWYRSGDDIPDQQWLTPDWQISLNDNIYLVHRCILGHGKHSANFFSSTIFQSQANNSTNLAVLLPVSCHDHWEVVLNFMYDADDKLHSETVTNDNIVFLYKIAHVLRIPALANRCIQWLKKHLNETNLFIIRSLSVAQDMNLELLTNICLEKVVHDTENCDIDDFLSLDVTSLAHVLHRRSHSYASSSLPCEVACHYMRNVDSEHLGVIFQQLSQCFDKIRIKDAMYLFALSTLFASDQVYAKCLPLLNSNYADLNHNDLKLIVNPTISFALTLFNKHNDNNTLFNYHTLASDNMLNTMDVSDVIDVLDLSIRDFKADRIKVAQFVTTYLKRKDQHDVEILFPKFSKFFMSGIPKDDAAYLFNLSFDCNSFYNDTTIGT